MKNADESSRHKSGKKQPTTAPAPPRPDKDHRANLGSESHRTTQDDLGVEPCHRTEEMHQEKRSTFP